MIEENIGKKVKMLRMKNNLSQERLAELAGLDRTYITFIETGRKNVTVVTLQKIVNALGMSLAEFFSDIKDSNEIKNNREKLNLSLDNLEKSKIYTNKELSSIFNCSTQGGMRVSNKLKTVTLISKETSITIPYNDSKINDDGTFVYTGMGLRDDQKVSFTNQNGKVAYSKENGYRLFYFIQRSSNRYEYIGEAKLNGAYYFEDEIDILGNQRKVVKFPLILV